MCPRGELLYLIAVSSPTLMAALVKPLSWILGIVLTLVGLLGYVLQPRLLGLQVSTMSSTLSLIFGLLIIWAIMTHYQYAKMALVIFGIVYAVFAVLGFWKGSVFSIGMNLYDNILNTAVALAALIGGFGSPSDETQAPPSYVTPYTPPPTPPQVPPSDGSVL